MTIRVIVLQFWQHRGLQLERQYLLPQPVGGFVIGVLQTIPATYKEFRKIGIKKSETIISSSEIKYDSNGRYKKITTYSPPPQLKEITYTKYYYQGKGNTPYKAINYSIPEKKKRRIYYSR